MQGLIGSPSALPMGIYKDFAVQTVQVNLSDTAQIQVTVDGLTDWLEVEPADLTIETEISGAWGEATSMNITATSSGCSMNLILDTPPVYMDPTNLTTHLTRLEESLRDNTKIPQMIREDDAFC